MLFVTVTYHSFSLTDTGNLNTHEEERVDATWVEQMFQALFVFDQKRKRKPGTIYQQS